MLCQFCICYNVTLLKFLKLLNRRLYGQTHVSAQRRKA